MSYNISGFPFLKIVYAKVEINGKVELVPLKLYAEGSLEQNK